MEQSSLFTSFTIEVMDLDLPQDCQLISEFTKQYGLIYDKRLVDYTIGLFNEQGQLVGTGSYSSRILKYLLVDIKYRESNAFATIASHLIDKVLEEHRHIFVYTLPRHIPLFEGLGFKLVAQAKPLFCMLEFGTASIKDYTKYLESVRSDVPAKNVASIVMNCNPFTKGHQYLIEKAASENDILYLIVVEEDLSVFPFEVRWELIKKGIAHLTNVVMVKGSHYVVSGATFPSYFLKDNKESEIIDKQAELDINIFRKYIINTLGITRRYVGSERKCMTTAAYNRAMHRILPNHGVEVKEIDRLQMPVENGQRSISASFVRDAMKKGEVEVLKESLPLSTYEFLMSEAAQPIIKVLQEQ